MMTQVQWLERMARAMAWLESEAHWEPVSLSVGTSYVDAPAYTITARAVVLLPGYGEIVTYRLDNDETILHEETLARIMRYTDYGRYAECQEDD